MDTGSKSLAQLSEEGKEKKYIALETASKLSGYTKEYLERLCRLRKIEYKMRGDGGFALELESLLNETHTILLSYEGVNFLERTSLSEPPAPQESGFRSSALKEVNAVAVSTPLPQEGMAESGTVLSLSEQSYAQPIPRFGDVNHLNQQAFQGVPLSFVGRSVVSDGKSEDHAIEKEIHIPIGAGASPSTVSEKAPEHVTHILVSSGEKSSGNTSVLTPEASVVPHQITPVHIPISPAKEEKVHTPVKIPVAGEHTPAQADTWDDLLLGTPPPARQEERPAPASPYHPIKTSVSADAHHDDGPLFPEITKGGIAPASTFAPPSGQRVEVFDPGVFPIVSSGDAKESGVTLDAPVIPRVSPGQIPTAEAPSVLPETLGAVPAEELVSPLGVIVNAPMKRDMSERQPLPLMRVMPQVPIVAGTEHAIAFREAHPLLVSRGLNLVFGVFVATGSLFLLSGFVLGKLGVDVNSTSYVASVGAAQPTPVTSRPARTGPAPVPAALPFSNAVSVATDTPEGVLRITPVFDGGHGNTYEYEVVSPTNP